MSLHSPARVACGVGLHRRHGKPPASAFLLATILAGSVRRLILLEPLSFFSVHLLFASSNPHKVREVHAILLAMKIDVIGLDAVEHAGHEPVEDGLTFADNARIKAVHYARATGLWCLADDSGLAVDALGGEPGVRSARYAGVGVSRTERDMANNAKLLHELKGTPPADRTARFVCSMCLADPPGTVVAETSGTMEGMIGSEPRGDNGFGYDPLFVLPRLACTSAELPPDKKNVLSHRGDALRQMAERLRAVAPLA